MQGTNYPFSFDNVCDALNIDPEMLRQRLRGLARGHGATDRLGVGILCVKRLSRAQNMTATRVSPTVRIVLQAGFRIDQRELPPSASAGSYSASDHARDDG